MNQPSLLLADEPTGNLDPASAALVLELIADYHRKGGTVLLVAHDELSTPYQDRELILSGGRIQTP